MFEISWTQRSPGMCLTRNPKEQQSRLQFCHWFPSVKLPRILMVAVPSIWQQSPGRPTSLKCAVNDFLGFKSYLKKRKDQKWTSTRSPDDLLQMWVLVAGSPSPRRSQHGGLEVLQLHFPLGFPEETQPELLNSGSKPLLPDLRKSLRKLFYAKCHVCHQNPKLVAVHPSINKPPHIWFRLVWTNNHSNVGISWLYGQNSEGPERSFKKKKAKGGNLHTCFGVFRHIWAPAFIPWHCICVFGMTGCDLECRTTDWSWLIIKR